LKTGKKKTYKLISGSKTQKKMTNPITLVKALDAPIIPRPKQEKLRPRRLRRQEERDRDRAAKLNAK
jgi:hypothetical protein